MTKLTVLQASPSAIGRMPVAKGSSVPPWPAFAAASVRFTRATTVDDEIPEGLSTAIQPWIGWPFGLRAIGFVDWGRIDGAFVVRAVFIIVAKVAQALQGGEGAPDLNDSLKNLAINSAAVAAFSFLFARDFRGSARDRAAAEAEESLSRLELALGDGRVVPLANFRGRARPVLVSGPRAAVAKALKAAAPFREELLERGVRFVGVETDAADPDGEFFEVFF